MAFQERATWIALIVNLAFWVWYAGHLASTVGRGVSAPDYFVGLMIVGLIVVGVCHAALNAISRRVAGKNAAALEDERDRLFRHSGERWAYRVLLFGLAMLLGLSLNDTSGRLANALGVGPDMRGVVTSSLILLILVAAELTRWTTQIVLYRRQG